MFTKKIALIALILILILSLFNGCTNPADASSDATAEDKQPSEVHVAEPLKSEIKEKSTVQIGCIKGPSSLGMLGLMDKNEKNDANNIYKFTVAGAPQDIQAKLINGELDIAAIPTNLAAALYNKTDKKLSVIAVSTLGVLYMLERGGNITSFADLEGKTLYASGQGATPEYVLNYLIEENELAGKVSVEYKAEHTELAMLMSSGKVDVAMLPQPFVTTVTAKAPDVRIALDLNDEWRKAANAELTMTCIVARRDFLENSGAAVDAFLDEYKKSTEFVNTNVNEAAFLSEKFDIIAEDVAKIAIPKCGIVFFEGDEMKPSINPLLEVLLAANPQSVGGSLPDDAFYYKR